MLKDQIVVWVKALVSAVVAWIVTQLAGVGIAADAAALEVFLLGVATGVVNLVLNAVADAGRRVSWLRPLVDLLWPNPTYGEDV